MPATLLRRWEPVLQLLHEHPIFLNSHIMHLFIELVDELRMEPEILKLERPTNPLGIHPADYLSSLADMLEDFAQTHPAMKPAAYRMRELANQALIESTQ